MASRSRAVAIMQHDLARRLQRSGRAAFDRRIGCMTMTRGISGTDRPRDGMRFPTNVIAPDVSSADSLESVRTRREFNRRAKDFAFKKPAPRAFTCARPAFAARAIWRAGRSTSMSVASSRQSIAPWE
jgi:hypothetical protein